MVILLPALVGILVVLEDAGLQPEESVKLPHRLAVAPGEVVVRSHEMRAASGQRVEEKWQRGDERLALAGGHLGDHPPMQADAADELHVEVDHVPGVRLVANGESGAHHPARGVFHRGENLGQNLIQHPLLLDRVVHRGEPRLPRGRLGAKLVVAEFLILELEGVDAVHGGPQRLHHAGVFGADDLFNEPGNHNGKSR